MSSSEVLIIGAGVAGMVLAQGLKHRGIPFRLFERDESLSSKSQGYRFRLVHEGLEALERTLAPDVWELLERTHPMDSPADLLKVDAHTGETVMALRAKGDTDRERRCYPIDRPWFRELLSLGLEKHIEFGKAFEKYAFIDDGHVAVTFADGSSATGRLLVAADGVHSGVAKMRFPELKHLDVERTTLWGRTPLTPEFERRFDRPDVLQNHFSFMFDPTNPARTCLFAPIRWPGDISSLSGGKLSKTSDYMFFALNFETPTEDINRSPETRALYSLEVSKHWQSNLRSLFEMQDVDTLYAVNIVSSKPDLPLWEADPRLTFVGDAIHTMSPSGGSGGLTTVQDVADLCDALADAKFGEGELDRVKLKDCLQLYEDKMRARAKTAIEWSFQGGKMVWAGQEWHEYSHVRSS
ncbi:putative FAD-binding domain-containing protein [Seiridium unicorne]|uniref:FAD-binding domain-containing protein n=1 Tax=Seiridium unicorne TaxID=138068 RepID=A0ABR2UL87_9PEZI